MQHAVVFAVAASRRAPSHHERGSDMADRGSFCYDSIVSNFRRVRHADFRESGSAIGPSAAPDGRRPRTRVHVESPHRTRLAITGAHRGQDEWRRAGYTELRKIRMLFFLQAAPTCLSCMIRNTEAPAIQAERHASPHGVGRDTELTDGQGACEPYHRQPRRKARRDSMTVCQSKQFTRAVSTFRVVARHVLALMPPRSGNSTPAGRQRRHSAQLRLVGPDVFETFAALGSWLLKIEAYLSQK